MEDWRLAPLAVCRFVRLTASRHLSDDFAARTANASRQSVGESASVQAAGGRNASANDQTGIQGDLGVIRRYDNDSFGQLAEA